MGEFLTQQEADALHAARHALEAIRRRAWDRVTSGLEPDRAYDLGIVRQAGEAAADGIFDLLNVTSSHLSDELASITIQRWYDDRDALRREAAEAAS